MRYQPRPVGEWPDRALFRPAASLVVRLLAPTSVTANQVSVAAGAAGGLSGVALAWPGGGAAGCVLAFFLIGLYLVLDCADGQLARIRGPTGSLGAIIDGVFDYVAALSLHLGILFRLLADGSGPFGWPFPGWLIVATVVLAGVSMAWHAAVFDERKHRHLEAVLEGYTRFNTTPEKVSQEIAAARNAVEKALLGLMARYLGVHAALGKNASNVAPSTPEEREAYDRKNRFWLQALSVIGPTHHFTVAAIALLLAAWRPSCLWLYVAYALLCNLKRLAVLGLWPRTQTQ